MKDVIKVYNKPELTKQIVKDFAPIMYGRKQIFMTKVGTEIYGFVASSNRGQRTYSHAGWYRTGNPVLAAKLMKGLVKWRR